MPDFRKIVNARPVIDDFINLSYRTSPIACCDRMMSLEDLVGRKDRVSTHVSLTEQGVQKLRKAYNELFDEHEALQRRYDELDAWKRQILAGRTPETVFGYDEKGKLVLHPHILDRTDAIGLDVRSENCLQNAGLEFVYQLIERTETDLERARGLGSKSRRRIRETVERLGLSLGTLFTPEERDELRWLASLR